MLQDRGFAGVSEVSSLSYSSLSRFRLRGMRNGNWRCLNRLEKALYRCALSLAGLRGRIVNAKLLAQLKAIVWKLLATAKTRILQVGKARAQGMLETFGEQGVFDWAPEVEAWLRDMKVVFYLGVAELFSLRAFIQ